MRYIICLIIVVVFGFLAWESPKCTHVYVAKLRDTITVERPPIYSYPLPGYYTEYNDYDGPDLVCVKCLHERRQRVVYTNVDYGNNNGSYIIRPDTLFDGWLSKSNPLKQPTGWIGHEALNEPYDTTALLGPLRIGRGRLNIPDTIRITSNR